MRGFVHLVVALTLEPPPIQRPTSIEEPPPVLRPSKPDDEGSLRAEPLASEPREADPPDTEPLEDGYQTQPAEAERDGDAAETAASQRPMQPRPVPRQPPRSETVPPTAPSTVDTVAPAGNRAEPRQTSSDGPRRSIAALPGAAAGAGFGLLVGTQAWRWARQRSCTDAIAMADDRESLRLALECASGSAVGSYVAATLGGAGSVLSIAGAIGTGILLGRDDARPGRLDARRPSHTTARIATGATLVAVGGATIVIGAPILLHRQHTDLERWSRWQGARFIVTDLGVVLAAVGGGLLAHALARRKHGPRVHLGPSITREHRGIVAAIRW